MPVRYGSGTGGFAYFICAGQFSGESYAAFRRHGNRMGGLPGRKYKDSDSVYSHSGSGRDRGKAAWCKEISGNLYGCECGTFGNPHDNACDDDCDHRAYRERSTYYALENGQYRLSQDQNFLVLLLDAVDAKTFEEVMDSDPAYTETFADFTHYPDMVGAYPWTAFSVPYILSGKWYEGEEYYLDYAAAAVDESGLFRELSERDYDIALYESDPWVTTYTYQFSNMVELQHEAYVWKYFRRAICKLGGIRYAPFFLKEYCYRAIVQTQGQHNAFVDESNPLYTWDLKEFATHMQEEEVTYQEGKCFRYYHLQGGHVPFLYDADLNAVGDSSYTETLEANIRVIGQFLDKLKQSDLYDNSVIIVMADHGFDPQNEVSAYDRQNPLFLVKGVGESHPLQTSLVPAAYEDLQDAYVRLMDGAAGDAIFPYQEGEKRERRYIFYKNTEHVMYEWLQTGPAWDFNAYRETGNKYPRKN